MRELNEAIATPKECAKLHLLQVLNVLCKFISSTTKRNKLNIIYEAHSSPK